MSTTAVPVGVITIDAEEALQVIDGTVRTDLEPRTVRAIDECLTVLDGEQPHTHEVYSEAGRRYAVDGATETCSCPDHEKRDLECKHLRRVRLENDRDPERWQAVTSEIGTAILGVDDEIDRLEQRIEELEAAQRALGRLVDRVDDLRTDQHSGIDAAPADAAGAVTPADD